MKRFNINEFIWFVILVSFAYYIYELFNTGKINLYIHPKMFKYVLFSLVIFIILAIFQVKRIFTFSKTKKIKLGYIIFIIPLFLAFAVNPDTLNAQVVANKGGNIVSNNMYSSEEASEKNYEESLETEKNTDLDIADGYNSPDGERFMETLGAVYGDLDEMIDKEIELSGFIYIEESLPKESFVIGRLMLSCCAADTEIIGLLAEWDEINKFEENEWIKITGKVSSTRYYNPYNETEEVHPLIKVTKVEVIDPPKNQYVYP